jgi:DNA-binding GntR family transcriptional regulator
MGTVTSLSPIHSAKRIFAEIPPNVVSSSNVDCVHRELRDRAIKLRFLPGERLNETILAKELGVSRTPVREALNRLTHEGLFTYLANYGFFRKPLDVQEICDLFEFRQQLEMAAVRLAVERATDEQLLEFERFSQKALENARTLEELTSLDEEFHDRLIVLTGNTQMRNSLRKVSDQIRYVREMDIDDRRLEILMQYREIVRSLRERNTEESMRLMSEHIGIRLDQITEKVERCYGRIYMNARLHPNLSVQRA